MGCAHLQLHLKSPALVRKEGHDAVVRVGRVNVLDVVRPPQREHAVVRVIRHGLRTGAEAVLVLAVRRSARRVHVAGAASPLVVVERRERGRGLEDELQLGAGGHEADP